MRIIIPSGKIQAYKNGTSMMIVFAKFNQLPNHSKQLTSCRLLLIASAVWVAFDRRLSGLTARTGREICGLSKASGRGARRYSGLTRSLGRMSSTTTGSGNDQLSFKA